MGIRFRKSVKIMPGVRMNFSKSGVSTSIGGPGATVNIGAKGTRQTIGIPGTGISYSHLTSKDAGRRTGELARKSSDSSGAGVGCIALILLGALILAITKCESGGGGTNSTSLAPTASDSPLPDASGAAAQFSDGDTVKVTSATLRTRLSPSGSGAVSGALHRGETATIVRRSGEWLQVAQGAALVWIAANHVRAVQSAPQNFLSTEAPRRLRHRRHSSSFGGFEDSSCPCSGRRVCIGPRGGRYCITRSGRKRYGV